MSDGQAADAREADGPGAGGRGTRDAGPLAALVREVPVRVGGEVLPMLQASFADVMAASATGDPGPWWAHIWPAGVELAEIVLGRVPVAGLRCLDLGAGAGLLGVVLGRAGAHVTFADLHDEALQLAELNARRNGLTDFELLRMDWNAPPARRFDRVFAADVLYEASQLRPLALALAALLAPDGEAWLSDPRRARHAARFTAEAQEAGLDVHVERDLPELLVLRLTPRASSARASLQPASM